MHGNNCQMTTVQELMELRQQLVLRTTASSSAGSSALLLPTTSAVMGNGFTNAAQLAALQHQLMMKT